LAPPRLTGFELMLLVGCLANTQPGCTLPVADSAGDAYRIAEVGVMALIE
jgi:hypothetical protein